jgi:hypothetical protein
MVNQGVDQGAPGGSLRSSAGPTGVPRHGRAFGGRPPGSHRMRAGLHGRLRSTRNCWLGQPALGVRGAYAGKLARTVLRGAGSR